MELAPYKDQARLTILNILNSVSDNGSVDEKKAIYFARTFPDVMLDIARLHIEQATNNARLNIHNPALAIQQQIKPYFMFMSLLGKAPQISNLMYSYFENSSFQPLPENLFTCDMNESNYKQRSITYCSGFDSELLRDILITYLKYLSFNPKWFSAVWNWSELGRIIALHPSDEFRYLAACCLSIITNPTRHQHMSFIRSIIDDNNSIIEIQSKQYGNQCTKLQRLFNNTFRPVIEPTAEKIENFLKSSGGPNPNGYSYCSESLANITNVLLLKRDITPNTSPEVTVKIKKTIESFVLTDSLKDTVSKIAYSASISRPCLIRGPTSSGKTATIDYIAAHTNRLNPPEYIKVQIGDQIDSKLIVGTYVCTEIPGQFEWQPGPLTQAMAYGSWIVFEDIDSAPSELAQVIHSVIENGNLSCVSCCPIKLDSPHPDFRIFFTQRTRKTNESESLKLGFGFVERLCDIVDMPYPSYPDLKEMLDKQFKFGPLTDTILKLFEATETSLADETCLARSSRHITLRDLFKLCRRIKRRKIRVNDTKYASTDLDLIFMDTLDCFLAHLPKKDLIKPAESLGKILNYPSIKDSLITRHCKMREDSDSVTIGRSKLAIMTSGNQALSRSSIAQTRQSMQLLESVAVCVENREPILLVGETGVGKTTIVQYLANTLKTGLVVINLSQQSDSSDLLGGYKPVDMREVVRPLHDKFMNLFKQTCQADTNQEFLRTAETLYLSSKKCSDWLKYLKVLCTLCGKSLEKRLTKLQLDEWSKLMSRARSLSKRISEEDSSPMALAFSEGSLLRAVRNGQWILLDEINLAEPDVLQCLMLVLDSMNKFQVHLNNHESDEPIRIHPNFRIFACMNPSTDVSKRDLPIGIRGRFTEFFVDDVTDKFELRVIVESYVKTCVKTPMIEKIVTFYQEVRERAKYLNDISGNSPVFSLRTLCRALTIAANDVCHNIDKSLFEALKITFLQQLNQASVVQVLKLIEQNIFGHDCMLQIEQATIAMPQDNHNYVQVENFWIQASSQPKLASENYIITASVRKNLQRIARIISLGQRRLPILIQGNTSVGKTSLIKYLAKLTGNLCIRINNHEHTDLQEYVGRYVLKENGELKFQEGLLVTAMKKGYWVILDELNLAPCELLEALNRVLDDNRELFIPETREIVKAHSKFILFATQNPPEEYAGRKLLSRAFRNRFIELHFDEIPHTELEEILHKRCQMAPQHSKKIVSVMKELQVYRRESGCFNGKNGFMTMRDLFRWGERYARFKDTISDTYFDWDEYLASEGLVLLEGRMRTVNEADIVKSIIEKVFKRELDRDKIYALDAPKELQSLPMFKHIHLTPEFRKMFVQLKSALHHDEPVLLCGQTGCGKTTACQLYAELKSQHLITYNCHLNTESSDFIGDVRPGRHNDDGRQGQQMFLWLDGPLVHAMRNGSLFLMDEISLADDAVLERINSVLEPERTITLSEKDGEEVAAQGEFRFVATMNPGGDYGKKELSPALRNRFTEIYCHNTSNIVQIAAIIEKSLSPRLLNPKIAPKMIQVIKRFLKDYYKGQEVISLRDVLNWAKFLNRLTSITLIKPLSIQEAILEGACLVFFDQFGTCAHKASHPTANEKLKRQLEESLKRLVDGSFGAQPLIQNRTQTHPDDKNFKKIDKYFIMTGPHQPCKSVEFVQEAPVVQINLKKLVRAMQLDKPILLEGDPGAGKTSIVATLAKITGHKLVRINLSEQTDISDLFGSDLPDTSDSNSETPKFSWSDGPMLKAIKESSWILLDEMNLASQSVLEGLNACFDHRGEIFIPELNKKFIIDRSIIRIFACQNPYSQGAARKGLPQSFVNRFTSIYIESHSPEDQMIILNGLYPAISDDTIAKMILFNSEVRAQHRDQGYEFNLRDMIYWCNLMTKYATNPEPDLLKPDRFVQFVYMDRMRSISDKMDIFDLFEKVFSYPVYVPPYREIRLGERSMIIGRSILARRTRCPPHLSDLTILKYQLPYLESIAKALEFNKMPILVGQYGVGKRSMVRILAGLTGNKLNVIGANRDMDTIELLGSFEQKSLQRELVELIEEARGFVTRLISSEPLRISPNSWSQLYKYIWTSLFATSVRDLKLSRAELMDAYRFQLSQMEELIVKMKPYCNVETESKFKYFKRKINNLKNRVLYKSESTYSSGNFEWIDSILIKSIREGSWLMIENANLMNPATLDRLNSLVEPNGSICLNEKGSSGSDGIETLKPHPDFRLILAMDPEHGELSRAMRNRGVEIAVKARFYFEDFLLLLDHNGFEPEENKACMTYCIMQTSYDAHLKITDEEATKDGSLLAYFGLNYLTPLVHQIRRGVCVDKILSDLITAYYRHKGYLDEANHEEMRIFISEKMAIYRKKFVVKLNDDMYNWCNFKHDLPCMTGGDANVAMLSRDTQLFENTLDPVNAGILKFDEMVDDIQVVICCITTKVFLESSTLGDLENRKNFIKPIFAQFANILDNVIAKQLENFLNECVPLINDLIPRTQLLPIDELFVDTRNSPDLHYYLKTLDKETTSREVLQNRWILTLHRITIKLIIDLIEERSMQCEPGATSLWILSEQVRNNELLKQDLIRPNAQIATDLHDFLIGIMRVASDRCFENQLVAKMMARFFWIGYFIGKLRRGYNKLELVAICNQIPMLWALTYQKVIVPIIKDCELADLSYNGHKFSNRIQHICDFLDVTVTKPSTIEKSYHKKVLNMHAVTPKRCAGINREVDKFFALLLGRYTLRSQSLDLGQSDNIDTLAASGLIWTNSIYMMPLYTIMDKVFELKSFDEGPETFNLLNEAMSLFEKRKEEYSEHERWLKDDRYRAKCLTVNRKRNALDQFAPVWQVKFIHSRNSLLTTALENPSYHIRCLRQLIKGVHGVIMSPRYYSTLVKFLSVLVDRQKQNLDNSVMEEDEENTPIKLSRQNVDMYSAFLLDHLAENIVFDNQVVGWTKLRVTTSDLDSTAPLIPEYSPIISLVSSYCLDIKHLKLNSYQESSAQLESMLIYLWRAYALIKYPLGNIQDLNLAQNLMHSRLDNGNRRELVGSYVCNLDLNNCNCVEEYIRRRAPKFDEVVQTLVGKSNKEDVSVLEKSIKLIYFGFYNMLEYAPIFTLDPALRSREKLEVYKSELTHTKLDLHQRNTLYYWKTGDNLRLLDITPEEAKLYPFTLQVLIERRAKLEKSIAKLINENTNRPKSDDGSHYFELRKDVEVSISRYTSSINSLINDSLALVKTKMLSNRIAKLTNLVSKSRMLIRNLEKSIIHFRSDYALYSDLTTNYLLGMCFILQGLRRLYSRMEQKLQLHNSGFARGLVDKFSTLVGQLFSFNNFTAGNLEAVNTKRALYSLLPRICPEPRISYIQSLLLKSILIQLKHHIVLTPSDINKCIPIVQNIAEKFHWAWLERKKYLEEQRQKQEELYQYKTSRTTLGGDSTLERREFIEICSKFPTYDHIYKEDIEQRTSSVDEENLITETKILNLHRSVDLTMCIDICKAHYKFMREASLNLLGQQNLRSNGELKLIDFSQLLKLEAEIMYTVTRHCLPSLDTGFDSMSAECHLLQTNELIKLLARDQSKPSQIGPLRNSIDILDEDIFNIYHDANPTEALRFRSFISKVDEKANSLRAKRGYENAPNLLDITRLISKISSFLITDPLMKFVSGAHILLQRLNDWNYSVSLENRMTNEMEELIDLIKSWRDIEVTSWKTSLHQVKRKYIDDTLCDLWFTLYDAFSDPIKAATRALMTKYPIDEDFDLGLEENEHYLYGGFTLLMKDFFENATLGDYQIRLDLVFSFAIQSRFASLYERARPRVVDKAENVVNINYEKLTTYVYNIHRQYQGMMECNRPILESEEVKLSKLLVEETRIVSWLPRANLWDIKNNFRISQRKVNKVMNKYLEVLRKPISGFLAPGDSCKADMLDALPQTVTSIRLDTVLSRINATINSITPPTAAKITIGKLSDVTKIVENMKNYTLKANMCAKSRYLGVMELFEKSFEENSHAIQNFQQQKVHEVTIRPRDSKEIKNEKYKQCRQMFHNKRFAMQSIFKNLQQLGISYQRGLNSGDSLDSATCSLEPLRGMIQHQTKLALSTSANLVEDSLVDTCNQMYRDIMQRGHILLSQQRIEQLSADQYDRIMGCCLDITIDGIVHMKNAAMIYRHLMDIQAATARLRQLQKRQSSSKIRIYNFNRVHSAIKSFNQLVSRAFSYISKLDKFLECYKTVQNLSSKPVIEFTLETDQAKSTPYEAERSTLSKIIHEIDDTNSLLTDEQYDHIQNNLEHTRKEIGEISCELRDKLNCTISNYLYSDDDIEQLRDLYERFRVIFDGLLPPSEGDTPANTRPLTVLGSMTSLTEEAERNIKPLLDLRYLKGEEANEIEVDNHPNSKLDIRLKKLVKQMKVAIQEVYKNELNISELTSEAARRKSKPFNQIDSSHLRDLLRPEMVAKYTANCFMTLNLEANCTNIESLVLALTPILYIYVQDVAYFLNVVLSQLQMKLFTAKQIFSFFIDLSTAGFGLPCKLEELEEACKDATGEPSEDNAGFGEGEGKEDASKKLEFESQLDDLKKDDQNENNDASTGDNQESIEAHDDGIEMSEDIDAKAEGAPEDEGAPGDEEQEQPEDDERLNELDKELDTVDKDEGNLDNELWGDEDEDLGEENEEDLREAAGDPSIRPDLDEKDLMAKNQDLAQASSDEQVGQSENSEADGDPDKADSNDKNADDQEEADNNEHGLDLEEEAAQARQENPDYIGDLPDNLDDDENDAEMNPNDQEESAAPEELAPEAEHKVDFKEEERQEISMEVSDGEEPEASAVQTINQDNVGGEGGDEAEKKSGRGGAESNEDEQLDQVDTKPKEERGRQGLESQSSNKAEGGEVEGDASLDDEETNEGSKKRTLADTSTLEQQNTIKRQKITDGEESDDASQPEDGNHGDKGDEKTSFKHLSSDTDRAIEMIDLASDLEDTEDFLLDIGDKLDPSSTSSKPKDATNAEPTNPDEEKKESEKSSYNTNLGLLKYISHQQTAPDSDHDKETVDLMERINHELAKKPIAEHDSIDTDILTSLWLECTRSTSHLVHELCQQLQIVLQPTKMSKYKGDYKSGKRLNMRKIISYIASHYRKDKIWLRRTKPCKRTYNICLAVDNSSSMSENNCRQMTYQSLALLAKSLSLIEVGSLSVAKFGEQVKCIHDFSQPYADANGAQWLRELRFNETKTSYKQVLKYACEAFERQLQETQSASVATTARTSVNQLLVLISDGRNVTSEAEDVKYYQKQLRSLGVLTLFVIIDDLRQNGKSIVDVKTCVKFGSSIQVNNYMDLFPFPFYVLLRQLETMPSVLGDALRQWFELVCNYD